MPQQQRSTAINIILWIAQGLLALTLIYSGLIKIFAPAQLPFPWIKDNPSLAFLTGIVDILGGTGIILPSLLKYKARLTIIAACGIMLLMASAITFHIARGEANDIGFNIFLMVIAAFVAWAQQRNAQ
jgi:hypothetical protein